MTRRDVLINHGCTEIEHYTLISNFGYTFLFNGIRYDARFWANCYGCYIGKYMIHVCSDRTPENKPIIEANADEIKRIEKELNEVEG